MDKVFGIPMDGLMLVLAGALGILLLVLLLISLRGRVIFKLGVRNIPRRRAQTALIVAGLTLSTVIIASALGTGDTLTHSIRSQAVDQLGLIDEIISGPVGPRGISVISQARYDDLRDQLKNDPFIDGIAPAVLQSAAIINPRSGQGEPGGSVLAVDADYDRQFGPLRTTGGGQAEIADLPQGEVYLNRRGAAKLAAEVGDTLEVYLGPKPAKLRVTAIVENEGLRSGNRPVIILPLAEAQKLLNLPGEITSILVSNDGGVFEGAQHSRVVTERLRGLLIKEPVAVDLVALLRSPEVGSAIEAGAEKIPEQRERLAEQVAALRSELQEPEITVQLRSLIADNELGAWIAGLELLSGTAAKLADLFSTLSEMSVNDVKARSIASADEEGANFVNIFIILGSFSIMAGVLMIFLIFVMLAAERKREMGMARAVGMQRRHLVQMFVTEGAAYDLLAALAGVVLGVGVSYIMVQTIAGAFSQMESLGSSLQIRFFMAPRSLAIAYSLGVLLTFVVVTVSSWQVSRLNIVSAMRDLPGDLESKRAGWLRRVWRFARGPLVLLLGPDFAQ